MKTHGDVVSKRLKEFRKKNGMRQEDLASLLGVASGTVSIWESGKTKPEYGSMEAICSVFHVSMTYLLSDDGQPDPPAVPNDEILARWKQEDKYGQLRYLMQTLAQLSPESRYILAGAITTAYKLDKELGRLDSSNPIRIRIDGTKCESKSTS